MESFTPDGPHRVTALKGCGHLFGKSCALAAIKAAGRCPLCSARAKQADVLTLFNAAGLVVGGDSGGRGAGGSGAAGRIASLEAALAAALAEARRLRLLNKRLAALCGGGGGGAGAPLAGEHPSPARAPAPAPAADAPARPRATVLARLAAPGGMAVAICPASGVAVVGCCSGAAGGPARGASVRVLSLLAPTTPARIIALPEKALLAGGGGGRVGVWSIALRPQVEGAATAPQAAVLFGTPPPSAPRPGSGGDPGTAPCDAAIANLDLWSGGVVAAWACEGRGGQRVVWLAGEAGAAQPDVATAGRAGLLTVYGMASKGRFGWQPSPAVNDAWRQAEEETEAETAQQQPDLPLPGGATVLATAYSRGHPGTAAALVKGARPDGQVEVWLFAMLGGPARAAPLNLSGQPPGAAAKRARP